MIDLGSFDSFAKVKLDSTHPDNAQEEMHNAATRRNLPVHGEVIVSSMPLIVAFRLVASWPDCVTLATVAGL